MSNIQFTNFAATTLASGINSVVTSLTVATGTGALFPTLVGAQYFYCVLADAATGVTREVIKVTARSTDTFTITRAQDSTTGQTYATGDKVELRLTAAGIATLATTETAQTFTGVQTFAAPILGTPTSGTVTNLTGTASININGTVGATTPAAGAFTTLSATGITTVAAGSAALPAIVSTTGTADTGLWFPAADTVAASTAGVERLRIDSSGYCYLGGHATAAALIVYPVASNANGVSVSGAVANGTCIINTSGASTDVPLLYSVKGNAAHTFYVNNGGTKIGTIDANGVVVNTPSGSLGYGTGAGGSVTQATSKATAVTLNKPCGTITLAADALASNTTARFSFNNSILAITDTVILIIRNGVTAGAYLVWVDGTAAGSCTLAIRNISGGSLSDAVALNFAIIKGVTA